MSRVCEITGKRPKAGNNRSHACNATKRRFLPNLVTKKVVDPKTGRVDLRYNPMSIDEDYFIPVRGAQGGTKIETLPGGSYTGDIDDVKYLRDKLFSALKIPASYLSRAEGGDEDKATLAQKDIRFARTVQRLQRAIISELEKIGIVHLYTLGFRQEDLVNFKLSLTNPSKIAELQELEHWKVKFDAAGGATEKFFSRRWIAKNFFGLSDEEILQNQREMFYDAWLDGALEGTLEGEVENTMGDLGVGDEELGGLEDLEDDTGDADESALLSAPPKRDDGTRTRRRAGKIEQTTDKSKDKWYASKDQRGGSLNKSGARKRRSLAQGGGQSASSSARNIFAGGQDISGLAGLGLTESISDTNYEREERKLFEVSAEITRLIADLEKNNDEKSEKKEEK